MELTDKLANAFRQLHIAEHEMRRILSATLGAQPDDSMTTEDLAASNRATATQITTIIELSEILSYRLLTDKIAVVVRAPARIFDDMSILDMLYAGRHLEVLDEVKNSFDYSRIA